MRKIVALLIISIILLSNTFNYAYGLDVEKTNIDSEKVKGYITKLKSDIKESRKVRSGINGEEIEEKNKLIKQAIKNVDSKKSNKKIDRFDNDNTTKLMAKEDNDIDLEKVFDRRIIIKIKQDAKVNIEDFDCILVDTSKVLYDNGYRIVKVPKDVSYIDKLQEICEHEGVELAEPDYVIETDNNSIEKDAYNSETNLYNKQWYLNTVNISKAWEITKGSENVVVAVIDSGIDNTHKDLESQVIQGEDFTYNYYEPIDDNGHGTHVAGIIAGDDDKDGIVGIAPNCKVLNIKALDYNGISTNSSVLESIYFAILKDVDVINLSLGSNRSIYLQHEAIKKAIENNIVVVAAAGNDNENNPYRKSYPASYKEVISVAASDSKGNRTDFSYINGYIDIAAPGEGILSSYPIYLDIEDEAIDGYSYLNGTSMAAPIVSGTAALLKSIHPDWGPEEIEYAIEYGSVRESFLIEWDEKIGYGIINVYNALKVELPDKKEDIGDTIDEAKKMFSNSPFNECIDMPGDKDVYSFKVNKTSNVMIELNNLSANLDLIMKIEKYNNGFLTDQISVKNMEMGVDRYYTFEAQPGDYYITIEDYRNHWSTNPYEIKINIQDEDSTEPEIVWEVEPNDSTYIADEINIGEFVGGYIDDFVDFDYYKIDIPNKGDICITFANLINSEAEPLPVLFNNNGDIVNSEEVYYDTTDSANLINIIYSDIESGQYYIVVGDLNGNYDKNNPYVYTINYIRETEQVPIPTSSVESGEYYEELTIKLSCQDPEAIIKYTIDGSEPTENNGIIYDGPFSVDKSIVLKVRAFKNGNKSKVNEYNYKIYLYNVNIVNNIKFNIKLNKDIPIKQVELIDEDIILSTSNDIYGNTVYMKCYKELRKPKYKIRITTANGKKVTTEVLIKPSIIVVDMDVKNKTIYLKAMTDGKLYKNNIFIKDVKEDETITIEDLNSKDNIQLVPLDY